MIIIGGLGSVLGSYLGAVFILLLPILISFVDAADHADHRAWQRVRWSARQCRAHRLRRAGPLLSRQGARTDWLAYGNAFASWLDAKRG